MLLSGSGKESCRVATPPVSVAGRKRRIICPGDCACAGGLGRTGNNEATKPNATNRASQRIRGFLLTVIKVDTVFQVGLWVSC